MRNRKFSLCATLLLILVLSSCETGMQKEKVANLGTKRLVLEDEMTEFSISLKKDWRINSLENVDSSPEIISTAHFDASKWYHATVPSTVMGNLVNNGVYPDIFHGINMESVDRSQFNKAWYYRREFEFSPEQINDNVKLIFEGINFSADVWLNGKQIATSDEIYGAYNMPELDISDSIVVDGLNVIAILVYPPKRGDFTVGFVDWTPKPADKNMGIYREVKIRTSGSVSIENPFITTDVNLETLAEADISLSAELANHGNSQKNVLLKGEIGDITFEKSFSLGSGEVKKVDITSEEFSQLNIKNPKLWWPVGFGDPNLYSLKLTLETDSIVSDSKEITFGIREVGDYINDSGNRGYTVNGKEILIRGGGWMDDLFLNEDEDNLEAQMKYVKHMNLNTIRLEGFWGSSRKLYSLADKYGILLMAGFSCQWEWEEYLGKNTSDKYGGILSEKDFEIVTGYLNDQVLWLRNHPSILVWVMGSDMLPKPELEKQYKELLGNIDPTRPYLATCAKRLSSVSGTSGVKMNGPYDYVAPSYWYEDKDHGGAFGFNTETGPGPQIPPYESIKKMIPENKFWPVNYYWGYHCARGEFNNIDIYKRAFDKRYGKAESVEEFAFKAQAANYEAMRAMFEAFGSEKPVTTGIIQWMLNSAWPKMVWQLYDYYLVPNGAFYATKKASEEFVLSYNYANNSIYLVNNGLRNILDKSVDIKVFNIESKEIFNKHIPVSIEANGARMIAELPELTEPLSFVSLSMDIDGKVYRNFYWLSSIKDRHSYPNTSWYVTPISKYADFKSLNSLHNVDLDVNYEYLVEGEEGVINVTLSNPTDKIAFFIELSALDKDTNELIVPVFWDDNYISLLPNETRTVSTRFPLEKLNEEAPIFSYKGWNVEGL